MFILKDFKSNDFGSADSKGVICCFFGSAHSTGVRGEIAFAEVQRAEAETLVSFEGEGLADLMEGS